jgi:hypothetical protein
MAVILLVYIPQKYYLKKFGIFFHGQLFKFVKNSNGNDGSVAPAWYIRAVTML